MIEAKVETLSLKQVSTILGIAKNNVPALVKDDILVRTERGRYTIDSVAAYVANLKDQRTDTVDLTEARKIKVQRETELLDLKLAEERGELIRVEKVRQKAFATGRQIRDSMLGIPTRISTQLAATPDVHLVEQMLAEAITEALDTVSIEVDDE